MITVFIYLFIFSFNSIGIYIVWTIKTFSLLKKKKETILNEYFDCKEIITTRNIYTCTTAV